MPISFRRAVVVIPAVAAPAPGSASAKTAPATRVGLLECKVSGGVGFVITSSRALSCVFRGRRGVEYYSETVRRFGLDPGFTGPGRLAWAVFAPARGWPPAR